jgi:pimeloyl-ACP methyl ester carboxylesterase
MPYFISQGQRLFYREQRQSTAEGSGPLLLILHGNTASSAHHGGELEYFGQRYHAVALDCAGCGQSDRVEVWPVDWWARNGRDAAALVNHLGYEHALVMGTSGGGLSALWMAIQQPERVRAIVADSCAQHLSVTWCEGLLQERNQRTDGQVRFWRDGHGNDWEQVVQADSDLMRRFVLSGGDWFNGRLAEIGCPVLFTASLRDGLLQDVGQQVCAMAMQVQGSRVFFATEGGHPLMWSRPDDFRRAADCFLDTITCQ